MAIAFCSESRNKCFEKDECILKNKMGITSFLSGLEGLIHLLIYGDCVYCE